MIERLLYQGSRAESADLRIVRDQIETPYIIRFLDARDEFSTSATNSQETNTHATLVTADIGFQGLPHDRVQLVLDRVQFYRSVTVESRRDSANWRVAGHGLISRIEDRVEDTVWFPEQWDRYLRIHIFNHDNPPLVVRRLILSAESRVVDFPAEAGGQYWLYYGSAGAHRPSYDFAQTRPLHVKPFMIELGPGENNPAYRESPKPWTDRRPGVLYGVLALAIVIMGFIAVRFLLKVKS